MSAGKKATLFFIPFPIMSHLVATVKKAELLADRDDSLEVTVLVMKLPIQTNISVYNSTNPRINVVELPQTQSESSSENPTKPGPGFIMKFIESQKGAVRDAVTAALSGRGSNIPAGFVIDMFCTAMIDVADELGIPTYVFFTCGAATLALMLHVQSLGDDLGEDVVKYKNSGELVTVPGYINPVPAAVWPALIFDEETKSSFFEMMRGFRRTKGILGNTFLEFETYAIEALRGRGDGRLPPFYPVGPILQPGEEESDENKQKYKEIMDWLDEQPDSSVVFLCFGTRGGFEDDQINEIAAGIEKSGHRFLWAMRRPPPKGGIGFPVEYENYGDVLPEGYLERTSGWGKVLGWAPQMAVLAHRAVGGFVSHCGWNSTLESVWFGVPVATWPLGAEQQANAFQLVKELEIAVEIKVDFHSSSGEIIPSEKIGSAIRDLMDLENPIRAKIIDLKDKSRKTLLKGESSDLFLGRFIDDFLALFSA